MTTDLILEQTSVRLLPALLTTAFAKPSPGAPRGAMHGQELWLALTLSLDDAACAAFMLDFVGQGRRVKASARGPSTALLVWAFHALAASLGCALLENDARVTPTPDVHRDTAIAYLTAYEADVRATRRARDEDPRGFLSWLAHEEHIVLAGEPPSDLPMDDPAALYELLLECDAIEDVFVSERELTSLLGRYRARLVLPG